MFRRRRQHDRHEAEADEALVDELDEDGELGEADEELSYDESDTDYRPRLPRPPATRPIGPWDVTEVEHPEEGRADLGGVLVPVFEEMELRVEVHNDEVTAVTAVIEQSAIQIQAFAAPRSEGIWDEVRIEIAAGITQQGGLVDEIPGPLGTELRAQVQVQLPDGTSGAQILRFVGCDGPRWFLRGVISGQAAASPETAGPVEEVFRGVVVVRGAAPMAPRDAIPLRLPDQGTEQAADQDETDESGQPRQGRDPRPFENPFERGPEITEVR